jgi:hypothetical protein
MRTKLAAAAVVASMLGGAGAGVLLSTPSVATAQTATTTAQTDPPAQPQWMTDALKKLVDDGTINQAQADAVAAALEAAKPARGPGGPGRPGPGRDMSDEMAAVAKAIGISDADLKAALDSGRTIADVAKAHNVDVQKVIDALVAHEQAELATAVADGKLTQAQADERKTHITERVTDMVNGTFRGHHGPPPGDGPPAPPAQTEDSSTAAA